MNQREFSDLTSLLTAVTNGEIPPYAKAVLEGYIYAQGKFIIIIYYLSPTHIMPCSGTGKASSDYNYYQYTGIDPNSKIYYGNTRVSNTTYTVTKATAYWTN